MMLLLAFAIVFVLGARADGEPPSPTSPELPRLALSDFITHFSLCVIEDVINQMPFLSLGEATLVYLLRKGINNLAHLLQLLV